MTSSTTKGKIKTYNLGTYFESDYPSIDAMCEQIQKDAEKVLLNKSEVTHHDR